MLYRNYNSIILIIVYSGRLEEQIAIRLKLILIYSTIYILINTQYYILQLYSHVSLQKSMQ